MLNNRGTKIMANTNTNTNTKEMKNAERAAKAAERLAKAQAKFEAAKNYDPKKTGLISEGLREARASRIAAFTLDDLASACVKRTKELMNTQLPKTLMRYLKAEVANAVKAQIGDEKLAMFVHFSLGVLKVDQAIKYACSSSRNEDVKALVSEIRKAEKAAK